MAASPGTDTSTPVVALSRSLRKAQFVAGPISTPKSINNRIQNAIQGHIHSKTEFDSSEVEGLVEAIDHGDPTLCKRLDASTLCLVGSVMRISKPCHAQQRGFFLLAECIHENPTEVRTQDTSIKEKKTQLGKVLLNWTIRRFLEHDRSNGLRKSLGAFSLELLASSDDNVALMTTTAQEKTCDLLGQCAINETSEVIKLIAGSIIRELLAYKTPMERFWPGKNETQRCSEFPKSQSHTSQWIFDFASFVDKQRPRSLVGSQQETVVFAAAVLVGQTPYTIEGASAILVVVDTHLSLVILSTTMDPSLYLDIPFESLETIEHTDSHSQPLSQALSVLEKSVQYCLNMRLKLSGTENHYFNAKGGSADSITLVFDDPEDSKLVSDAILKSSGEKRKDSGFDVSSAVFELSGDAGRPSDPGSVSNGDNAHALSEIASDAVTAMNEQSLEQDTLAAETEAQDNTWHGLKSQDARLPEVRALGTDQNTDQNTDSDLRLNGSTLPTSPFDGRVPAARVLNASSRPATPQDAPLISHKIITENQAGMHSLQRSGSTAADVNRSSMNLNEGPASEHYGSWDSLYDVSPKRSEVNQPHMQEATSAIRARSKKQVPLQAIVSEPRKEKLSQQMRDESGRTAAGTAELAREGAQKSRSADTGRRLSGPSKTASANSKKARYGNTSKRDSKATGSRTTKRPGRTRKDQEEDGVESASALQRPRHSHQASLVVQGSGSSHSNAPAMRKTIESAALNKPSKPLTQVSKSQIRRHHGPKPVHTTDRDDVNYDEAFEPDGDDANEGDRFDERPLAKRSKRGKPRKAPVGQKKIKRTPAQPRPPKASVPPVSLATRKPRRIAAVKANKAIQGIADYDVVEDEIVDDDSIDDNTKERSVFELRPSIPSTSTANAPPVARPTKSLPHLKPSIRRSPMPPPATSHITSKPPVVDLSRIPRPVKDPLVGRSSAQESTEPVGTKASKTVEPSKAGSAMAPASAEITTGVGPPAARSRLPPTPEADTKTSAVAAKTLVAATVAEDIDQIEASPDQDPITAKPMSSPNEYFAPKKATPTRDASPRPVNSNHDDLMQSKEISAANQSKPHSPIDDFEETLAADDNAQPHELDAGLGHAEENASNAADSNASTHGKRPALLPQDGAPPKQSAFASAAPNMSDLQMDPTQAHFEEAMAFAQAPGGDLSSDLLQAPISHQKLQTKSGHSSFQPDTRRDNKTEVTTTSTSTPAPVSKKLTAAKLESALSAIPKLHPETITKHRPIPPGPVLPSKGRSPALQRGTRAAPLNASPILAEQKGRQKRREHLEDTKQAKRSKPLFVEDDTYLRQRDHASGRITPRRKEPKDIHRKPNIVHFEPTGPSNQGSSTRKPEHALASAKTATPNPHPDEEYRSKRKHVDDAQDNRVAPELLPEKRQKLHYRDEPKEAVEQAPLLPTKAQRANNVGQQRKASSQSSRVDEFGSPQPYQHARTTTITQNNLPPRPTAKQMFTLDDDSEVDENLAPYDDEPSAFPKVPLPTHKPLKQSPRAAPTALIANNSKHRPSSPLAPSSIITGLAAHKEQADGKLVVVRTAEIVVLKKRQDPFVEAARERSNSFMDLLRKSSGKRVDKSQAKQYGPPCVGNNVSDDQDPEKTLIGASDPDDEDASSTASETSSDSDDSSSEEEKLSDDGSVLAWQRALQPHQKATLDVLIEISHRVTKDLVNKEEAIRNMIEDYQRGGNLLIDKYVEAKEQEYAARKVEKDKVRGGLRKVFQDAKEELTIRMAKFKENAANLKSDLERRERRDNAAVEKLMAIANG